MNENIKDGLLAVGGGAAVAALVGLSLKEGVWTPAPKTGESGVSYEARIIYTATAVFAVLGAAGVASKVPTLQAASYGALGLAGAGLLSGVYLTTQASKAPSSQTSGAIMGIKPPAVLQMDAAMHKQHAPKMNWINTVTGKRW